MWYDIIAFACNSKEHVPGKNAGAGLVHVVVPIHTTTLGTVSVIALALGGIFSTFVILSLPLTVTRSPEALTCRMKVIDQNNDERMSHVAPGQPNHCSNQQDFYGNIQVQEVVTDTKFDFLVDVSHLNSMSCPDDAQTCYCPSVGPCSYSNFTLQLNSLVHSNTHNGNHNRQYHFTITATNVARLVFVEHLEILADDSPPAPGVVMEGAVGTPDIDYTSEKAIIVNWAGFFDHESGIKLYKVGLAKGCLQSEDFVSSNNNATRNNTILTDETTLTSVRLSLPEEGKYYTTVVAYNNAMEPSQPVCSDGILLDRTAPIVENLTLQSATMKETILCSDGSAWLITSNLSKHEMSGAECSKQCMNSTTNDFVSLLPMNISFIKHTSRACEISSTNGIIYLPIDLINIKWDVIEDDSQIHEAFVGIGSAKDSVESPDLIDYHTSHHKYFYKKRHTGLSNGDEFYVFVRVTNSAGLQTTAVLGSIILDESPPICPSNLLSSFHDNNMFIHWNRNEFSDNEQQETISSFFYQIGRHGSLVSGFKALLVTGCGENMCFKLDLSDVQEYDIQGEFEFYIQVYAFNNAGYYCTVNTEPFYLPSILPPGHGLVYDVTSDEQSHHRDYNDVDVMLASTQLCVAWEGFEHYDTVSYEFGVGITPGADDVVLFHQIGDTRVHCEADTNLTQYTRYFTAIRASSTGGKRVGISDGFTLVNGSDIESSILQVYDGQGCSGRTKSLYTTVFIKEELDIIPGGIQFHVGHEYTFIANASVSVFSKEARVYNQRQIKHLYYVSFVPMVRFPRFNMSSNNYTSSFVSVHVADCVVDYDVMFVSRRVSAYWNDDDDFRQYVTHYEVELQALSPDYTKTSDQMTIAYGKSTSNAATYSFDDIFLGLGRYVVSVRPCIGENCFKWTSSNGFVVTDSTSNAFSIKTYLDKTESTCSDVQVTISDVECPSGIYDENDSIVRWGVFLDSMATKQVTKWRAYQLSENIISQCIEIPVYPHQKLFTCVEVYCPVGPSGVQCVPLMVTEDPNIFDKTILYEVDSDSDVVNDIKDSIHASNIGYKLTWLHKAELDFTPKHIRVGGIIIGVEERQVTWYLLKDTKRQPLSCDNNPMCVAVVETLGGYCAFQGILLENEILYYVCAEIATYTTRNGQVIPSFQTCGDGFVIDENSPATGYVSITSQNGYITDNRHLLVHWNGFHDYHGYEKLGYPDSISKYEYSIGSNPFGQDVVAKTTIGLSNSVKINNPYLHSGSSYYATITAYDHVGHSSTVVSPGVMYDNTPPVRGTLHVGTYLMSHDTIGSKLNIHWTGFRDNESGIGRIQLGIGSTQSNPDIIYLRDFLGEFATFTDLSELHDGHKYFIIILVTNKAELTVSSSEAFVFDRSPPTKGTVRDGAKVLTPDLDFQANTTHTGCHWSGFSDPHSGVLYYTAGLGTQPSEDDVRIMTSTGIHTAITWQYILVPGVKYFCTVKACNGAGLCTSVSSNGFTVDNSPPIPGIVHVGVDGHHSRFWAHPDTIQAQWFGFSDVESGIRSYNVCIRRIVSETCDVLPFTNFLLADYMTISISLPLNEALCVVVMAENHLGMSADSVSDSFVVDASSPVVVNTPVMDSEEGYTSANYLYQFDPSIIKLSWKFKDSESPIIKHIVSVTTHHEGHTPVENIHLTNVNELRMSLLNKDWLKAGDTYIAKVTACNEAGLCTSATSNNILIDPTPPHLGGITEPMTWYSVTALGKTVSAMNITLSGFRDVESGIKLYHVKVGKTYSGSELSDGVQSFAQSNSVKDVDTIQVVLNDNIIPGQLLIITVWAENHAGLTSAVGKVTVTVVSSNHIDMHGELFILRHSCDIHYCNKDCTCAVVGQKCHNIDVAAECLNNNLTNSISLNIDIDHGSRDIYTPISVSSSCISARWTAYGSDVDNITRYEWSIGQANMPVGTGIFDPLHENLWHDVEHQISIVHCLRGERYLKHDTSYLVYLRAWISESVFIEFMSSPVHIDNTPPSIRMGRFIRENDGRSCEHDLDFTTTLDTLTACWGNVFTDPQSGIYAYLVSLGTTPGADDVLMTVDEGLNTSRSWRDLTLSPGTTYYITVTAINYVGLQTTLVSDGMLVDQERPYTGVVFNTANFHNSHTQNSQDVGVSFRGFADRHSAIETFFVAFDKSANASTGPLEFERIGLRNTFTLDNNNLTDGQWNRFAVKALDTAGFESEIIFSPPFIYDSSPPTGFRTHEFANLYNETLATENGTLFWTKMLVNHASHTSVYTLHLIFDGIGNESSDIVEVSFENQTHIYPIRADINDVYDVQTSFVSSSLLNDSSITIQMENVKTDLKIRVLLEVSEVRTHSNNTDSFVIVRQISPSELNVSINVLDDESGIKNIYVGAGSTRGGFQNHPLVSVLSLSNIILFTEALHGQAVHITAISENHSGDRSHFYASPIMMDHTPPIISNAVMTMTYDNSEETSMTMIIVTWEVNDFESSSTQCSCIIGENANNTVLDEIEMEPLRQHFQTKPLPLIHGIAISAVITCLNDANLEQVASVGPEVIAYLPPDVENAKVLIDTAIETLDGVPVVRRSASLMFSWEGIDDSFGIKGYSYRILNGGQVAKDWEDTEMRTYVSVEDISLTDNRLYTVEVTAFNNNGIYSQAINASVFVSGEAPSLTGHYPKATKNGNVLEIVWSDVFAVRPDFLPTFVVTLGSNLGLADILRRVETTEERHVFQNIYDGSDVFAIITCTYQTGESSVFRRKLSLS
ncbi:uncharacterized protein LOC117332255 [Pecten maximus]|uniref:uncharacterized protein LOC117332255 n=1 Tax=Pecten maximus TaxID=6579 RepID=UPI001458E7BE|nr:uncharacterized protein LOC117332255 [Pecten maximus]